MNSSARAPRLIRGARIEDDPVEPVSSRAKGRTFSAAQQPGDPEVFVIGATQRSVLPADATLATVSEVLEAARATADQAIAEARTEAARLVAEANAAADSIRERARAEGEQAGYAAARQAVEQEAAQYLAQLRAAAAEGQQVRDAIASRSTALLVDALNIAMRRLISDWYDADPARTAGICRDALQAAAGQDVLSVRVNPGVSDAVRVSLGQLGDYVVPDEGVPIGGCIVDLRNGTIDASLDSRLDLMAAALERAAGGER